MGYVVSAIFICWEYQRLGMHFRQQRILRASFWIKLMFILLEVTLAFGQLLIHPFQLHPFTLVSVMNRFANY
jgi:hypothetical protein